MLRKGRNRKENEKGDQLHLSLPLSQNGRERERKEGYSLDALVLLHITHVLTTTQPNHASNAPLRSGKRRSVVVSSSLPSGSIVLSRIGDDLGLGLVLAKNSFEKFDLLLLGREDETFEGGETVEPSDDLEGVSLKREEGKEESQVKLEGEEVRREYKEEEERT